jgi:co-chaperonin GroES (HSP10)
MSNINLGQAVDLSEMVSDAREFGDAEKAAQLPFPKGWSILCAVPEAEDKYESGLYKPDSAKQIEENATVVLFVLRIGDLCYKDEAKFPTGAWCKEGDFVLVRAYSGTRFKIHGREFRMINDDTVIGIVEDPRGYERA